MTMRLVGLLHGGASNYRRTVKNACCDESSLMCFGASTRLIDSVYLVLHYMSASISTSKIAKIPVDQPAADLGL